MVQQVDLLPNLYRIALAIGNHLNMEEMLEESLSTYLPVVNGIAGEIYLLTPPEGDTFRYQRIYGFHKIIGKNSFFQQELIDTAKEYRAAELEVFLEQLPLVKKNGDYYHHIMELPNMGLIVLVTDAVTLDPPALQALKPINFKLAEACRNCMIHQELTLTHQKETRRFQKLRQKQEEFTQARRAFLKIIGDFQSMTKALRDWDSYLNKIFDEVPEITFRLDPEGKIVQISALVNQYCSYTPEELQGKPARELYFDAAEYLDLSQKLWERGQVREYPVHFKTKNHRLLYAAVSAHLLFDGEGRVIGCEGRISDVYEWSIDAVALDKACEALSRVVKSRPLDAKTMEKEIAYRRQAETALKKISSLNEQIMSSVSAALIGIDENDRITHWNDAAERITGIPKSDVIGLSFLKCGLRWNWDKIVKSISICLEEERPVRLKHFGYRGPDERKGYLNITLNPVFTEKSEPAGILLIGEELSVVKNTPSR